MICQNIDPAKSPRRFALGWNSMRLYSADPRIKPMACFRKLKRCELALNFGPNSNIIGEMGEIPAQRVDFFAGLKSAPRGSKDPTPMADWATRKKIHTF